MRFTDKTLHCADCGQEFVWTVGEQAFFEDKHLEHEPRHCRACKARRSARREARERRESGRHVEVEAVCSSCGRTTTLPFQPESGRPVFCRDCYQQRRARGSGPA